MSTPAGELTLTAHAKVNLTLEVLRKRPDGFHEIRSVMQRISLADRLTLRAADDMSLRSSDPRLEGPDNLAWRAAALLRKECRVTRGVAMHLEKRIPVAAGLGGGSSDCAAALRGLNELWSLGLPAERLRELGARLGSDVPFFLLDGACALAEGRGEALTPLAPLPERWLVLAKVEEGISAGAVYGAFPPNGWTDGSRTSAWLAEGRMSGVVPAPFNALEPVAVELAPGVAAAREALLAAGATAAVMSGSGSTYFALCDTEAEARAIDDRLRSARWGGESWVARFVTL